MGKNQGSDWVARVMREAEGLGSMTPARSAAHAAAQQLINRYARESGQRGWKLTREIAAERLRELREILTEHRDMAPSMRGDIGVCVDELEEAFSDLKR